MPRPPSKKRLARFTQLTSEIKADPIIAVTVENFVKRAGVDNVGTFAQQHPKDFDLMCLAIDSLLEQAPREETPRWMG